MRHIFTFVASMILLTWMAACVEEKKDKSEESTSTAVTEEKSLEENFEMYPLNKDGLFLHFDTRNGYITIFRWTKDTMAFYYNLSDSWPLVGEDDCHSGKFQISLIDDKQNYVVTDNDHGIMIAGTQNYIVTDNDCGLVYHVRCSGDSMEYKLLREVQYTSRDGNDRDILPLPSLSKE